MSSGSSKASRIGVYVCLGTRRHQVKEYVVYCLAQYRPMLDRLVVVTDIEPGDEHYDEIRALADLIVPSGERMIRWTGEAYKKGLAAAGWDQVRSHAELLLFDSSFYGPIYPAEEAFALMAARGCDLWSMTFYDPTRDRRFKLETPDRIMHWNFCVVRQTALRSPEFETFWQRMPPARDYQDHFVTHEAALTLAMLDAGFEPAFLADGPEIRTGDPRFTQALQLVRSRCPIVERGIFTIDPISHEIQAIRSRRVLDEVERTTSYDIGLIWRSLLARTELRTLHTNLEQLDIVPDIRVCPEKTHWDFGGKVAVLLHLFYPDMIAEIRPLIEQLPCDFDLLITTASDRDRAYLLDQLADFRRGDLVVKLVEQNRGRDMSSLFISFREEMLSDKYGLALRLHSKRTPQVAAHLGDWFKDHCLLNLVPNRSYIANVLDKIERHPDIGVVIPPLIHMSFGTLGHSWFANRKPAVELARELGIGVPLDVSTPVAAYGTMFWFRPRALARMFRREWKWEDYNPEPHHVDGGMAHVQERLICYAAQEDNYRTLTVLSTAMAARNYVSLEYKLQLLASRMPSADIRRQYEYLEKAHRIFGSTWARSLKVTSRFIAKNANRLYKSITETRRADRPPRRRR